MTTATVADVLAGRAQWTLVEGDNADPVTGLVSLGEQSVDHVIMDPPFENEAHHEGRRVVTSRPAGVPGGIIEVKAISYAPITSEQRAVIAAHAVRVARRWILIFCQAEAGHLWRAAIEATGGRYVRMGVYHKEHAQPQYSGDRPGVGWEMIVIGYAASGRMRWNGGGRCARWSAGTEARPGYRLPVDGMKPLALMRALIEDFTDPGDLVLDPFAGSGTTGVACIHSGRRFIGFEKDPRHAATARRRLAGEEYKPMPGQLSLLGTNK